MSNDVDDIMSSPELLNVDDDELSPGDAEMSHSASILGITDGTLYQNNENNNSNGAERVILGVDRQSSASIDVDSSSTLVRDADDFPLQAWINTLSERVGVSNILNMAMRRNVVGETTTDVPTIRRNSLQEDFDDLVDARNGVFGVEEDFEDGGRGDREAEEEAEPSLDSRDVFTTDIQVGVLFGVLFCIDYFFPVLVIVTLALFLKNLNRYTKTQISLRRERSVRVLTIVVLVDCVFPVSLYYFYFSSSQPWKRLIFWPPVVANGNALYFFDALFMVVSTDYVVRMAMLALKAFFAILFGRILSHSTNERIYSTIEHSGIIYRQILPAPVWLVWLISSSRPKWISYLFAFVYASWKFIIVSKRGYSSARFLKKFWRASIPFGHALTSKELAQLQNSGSLSSPSSSASSSSANGLISPTSGSNISNNATSGSGGGGGDDDDDDDDEVEGGNDSPSSPTPSSSAGVCSPSSSPPNCPICMDSMKNPIVVNCSGRHVFCYECCSNWFERNSTCPLCRETVEGTGRSYRDGQTSMSPAIF